MKLFRGVIWAGYYLAGYGEGFMVLREGGIHCSAQTKGPPGQKDLHPGILQIGL